MQCIPDQMRHCDGVTSWSLTLTLLPRSHAPPHLTGPPSLSIAPAPRLSSQCGAMHRCAQEILAEKKGSQLEVEKSDRGAKCPAESHSPPQPSLLPVLSEDSSPVPLWRHAGGCPPAPEAESQGTTRAWRRRRGGRRGTLQGRNGRGPKGE